jgi:Acetoacetate decarboxylase (ADC)
MPIWRVPNILDAAAQAGDARRSARQATPTASSALAADPGDLVARALAILAEHSMISDEIQSSDQPIQPLVVSGTTGPGTQSVDLPLQRHVLSDGTVCPLPIRYFDVQCLVATFLTDMDPAAELLNGTGLLAVAQEDGKAVVLLYCIEYRTTDIGPYNEVGLTVVARVPGDPAPGIYVVNLPVTTALANRAGREIWGYNKFVAAIDIKRDGKRFSTTLRDLENATIGVLEGTRGASVPVPLHDILTFTLNQGRVTKTLINVLTKFHGSGGDGFVFKVGTSTHPMVNNLRRLGLDGARPVLVEYADPFQALLFPGRAL